MTAAAELVGVRRRARAPASVAELDAYFEAVRPELTLSPAAADTAAYLTEMPAVEPELDRPVAGARGRVGRVAARTGPGTCTASPGRACA